MTEFLPEGEVADEMRAQSFYRLHCGAAAAFVIIFCAIYYLMGREMEESRTIRMRRSPLRTRKEGKAIARL